MQKPKGRLEKYRTLNTQKELTELLTSGATDAEPAQWVRDLDSPLRSCGVSKRRSWKRKCPKCGWDNARFIPGLLFSFCSATRTLFFFTHLAASPGKTRWGKPCDRIHSTFWSAGVTMIRMMSSKETNVTELKRALRRRRSWAGCVRLFAGLCALICAGQLAGADGKPDRTSVGDTKVALKDISGEARRPFALGEDKASVLFFVLHDCPVANAYSPEIRRVIEAYEKKKVRFALVYVDPDLTAAEIEKHRKEYGHQGYPAFFDKKHVLVKATGADVTPEAAVIGADGRIVYRGRINNLYADYGKRRRFATEHDLRDALDAVLAGKPVAKPRTQALGCFIPRAD